MKTKRYRLLDSVRGAAIILMILYHAIWDLSNIMGVELPWLTSKLDLVLQRTVSLTFLAVSGFCFGLARRHLRRAITVLLGGVIVAAATYFVMSSAPAIFGVLVLIGSAMLIMIPLRLLLVKINPYVGLAASILLYIFTENVASGVFGGWSIEIKLPTFLYRNLFTAYLGFPPINFASLDYFPLIPWIFIYIAGFFIFCIFSRRDLFFILESPAIPPLEWLGRHALLIYLLHQPIIFAIITALNLLAV